MTRSRRRLPADRRRRRLPAGRRRRRCRRHIRWIARAKTERSRNRSRFRHRKPVVFVAYARFLFWKRNARKKF